MKKRILAILLCMMMCLSSIPKTVFAQVGENELDAVFTATAEPSVLEESEEDQFVKVTVKADKNILLSGFQADIVIPEGWSIESITHPTLVYDENVVEVGSPTNKGHIAYQSKLSPEAENLGQDKTDTIGIITYKVPAGTLCGSYSLGIDKLIITGSEDGTGDPSTVIYNGSSLLQFSIKEKQEAEDDYKFRVRVSSEANDGSIGSVKGTV